MTQVRSKAPDFGGLASSAELEPQLKAQRRAVDFDTFDIHIKQLVSSLDEGQIYISPPYQRKFRWLPRQISQLIESILLGIPVPSLFMATNADNTWEVVDGVQRLSAIVKFAGSESLRSKLGLNGQHVLGDLEKLTKFNGYTIDMLPPSLQLFFLTRPAKVITLNDKSDAIVRYDLFERLNTGGVALSEQEIRDCVFQGTFANKLDEWSKRDDFRTAVKLTPLQQRDATGEECVLRFFAFLHSYKQFDHSVTAFLNRYMDEASKQFDYVAGEKIFVNTFRELARVLPSGIRRPDRLGTTSLILYEGVSVGAALALQTTNRLNANSIEEWLGSDELRRYTTGATNSKSAVKGRIEFCRDRFLGKPYVSKSAK